MSNSSLPLDRLALAFTLASVVLGVLIGVIGHILEQNLVTYGYLVFVGFSIPAIVLGIVTRSSPLGQTAAISSSVMLVGSVYLLVF